MRHRYRERVARTVGRTKAVASCVLALLATAPLGARADEVDADVMARDLSTAAQRELLAGELGKVAVLLEGALVLSRNCETLQQLAQVQTMAGQFEEAIESYESLLKTAASADAQRLARAEIERLKALPAPYSDRLLTQERATAEAKAAFKAGLAKARAKRNEDAIPFLRASLVLDPLLPGAYRVLGSVYGKLGDTDKETEFLEEYLRVRPDGPVAETARRALQKRGVLAEVELTASFPSAVWVNGRPLGKNTPVKSLLLPKGMHTISFVNQTYRIIRNRRVKLARKERKEVEFAFGVVSVSLTPWARIRANGRDIGLWEAVGLPVGNYELSAVASDQSRKKTVQARIRGGETFRLDSW